MKKIRLFCFPYAGGSAAVYNAWRGHIHQDIDLQPIELAGRGKRIYDPLYRDINEAVEDVFNLIKPKLDECPYGFFGHSMGGLIAYELARRIDAIELNPPVHLFSSGRGAPHLPDEEEEHYWRLSDDQFRKKILELGGTPREFFENPELLEVFLPLLKNDFKIAELYDYPRVVTPLKIGITIFIGKEEELTTEQIEGWRIHSSKICAIHYFEGNHFFFLDETEKIVRLINTTLLQSLEPNGG